MPKTLTNAVISNAGRIAADPSAPIANLGAGAQLGVGPHLVELDAATPLALHPIVPVVVHVPTMFENIPYATDTLKALIERHAQTITGIDLEYTLESAQSPLGHDGQQINMPTHSRRTQINPSFTWREATGNLVWNFHKLWIEMIRHPDTQASQLGALAAGDISPQLLSSFTMDILFIQYDSTHVAAQIIDGFFVTSMYPQGTGPSAYQRTVAEVQIPERNITYNGIIQHSNSTVQIAKRVAELLNMHSVNYDEAQPVADSIPGNLANLGIQAEIAELVAEQQASA